MSEKLPKKLRFDNKPVEPTSNETNPIVYTQGRDEIADHWPEIRKRPGVRMISEASSNNR